MADRTSQQERYIHAPQYGGFELISHPHSVNKRTHSRVRTHFHSAAVVNAHVRVTMARAMDLPF